MGSVARITTPSGALRSSTRMPALAARYADEYVRLDGRWRFASRQVRTLYAMTHAELASGGLAWELRKRWPHRTPAPAELPAYLRGAGIDT